MPPYVRAPFHSRLLEVATALSSHVSTQGVRKAAHKRSAKVTKTNFTRSSLAYGRLLLSGSSEQLLECWRVSVRRGAVTAEPCHSVPTASRVEILITSQQQQPFLSLSLSLPSHSFNVLNDDDGWSCCSAAAALWVGCCRAVEETDAQTFYLLQSWFLSYLIPLASFALSLFIST